MYFAGIKFSNKESVAALGFAFSRLKDQNLNCHHDCLATCIQITDKSAPDLISQRLPNTATFELG